MKTKFSLFVVIFSFLFNNNILPQSNFSIEVNGGISQNIPGVNVLENWDNGWTAGAALKYSPLQDIEFGLNTSYSNLIFDNKSVNLVSPAVCCYRHEVSGNNSKLFETSLSVQLFSHPEKFISPYFIIKTGFYVIDTGEIFITSYNLDNNGNETFEGQSTYGNSGKNYFKVFAGGGFGISLTFNDNLQMRTQILYNGFLDGSGSFYPITSGIHFGL